MRIVSIAAASALLAMSTAAAAAPVATAPAANRAAALSVARAPSTAAKASRIGAEVTTPTLISIGILAVLTAGVLVLTSDDDDSDSN